MNVAVRETYDTLLEAYDDIIEKAEISVTESVADEHTFRLKMGVDESFEMERVSHGMILDILAVLLYLYKQHSGESEDMLYREIVEYLDLDESDADYYHDLLTRYMYNTNYYVEEATIFQNLLVTIDDNITSQVGSRDKTLFSKGYIYAMYTIGQDFLKEKDIDNSVTSCALTTYLLRWLNYIKDHLYGGEESEDVSGMLAATGYANDRRVIRKEVERSVTGRMRAKIVPGKVESLKISELYEMYIEETYDLEPGSEEYRQIVRRLFERVLQVIPRHSFAKKFSIARSVTENCSVSAGLYHYIDYALRECAYKVVTVQQYTNLELDYESEDDDEEDENASSENYDQIMEMGLWDFLCEVNAEELAELDRILQMETETFEQKNRLLALSERNLLLFPNPKENGE